MNAFSDKNKRLEAKARKLRIARGAANARDRRRIAVDQARLKAEAAARRAAPSVNVSPRPRPQDRASTRKPQSVKDVNCPELHGETREAGEHARQ